MSIHTDQIQSSLDIFRKPDPLNLRETHWGYVVTEGTTKRNSGVAAEATMKVLSIVLMFGSIIPWVAIGGELAAGAIPLKIAHSVSIFAVGVAVYWHAGRGFKQEIHVDGTRQEFRLATRNSRNISTIRRRIPMAAIESCFLKRSKTSASMTKMLLRLKGRQFPLSIASGKEHDLLPILERLAEVVKSTRRTA